MDIKKILISDANSFHIFLGSSLQLLNLRGDRTSDDSSLGRLRNSLTELRELYDKKIEKDLNWVGALIVQIPPYKWLGTLLQKPAPKLRFSNYPSFMESDLNSQRKRVQVSQLIQKFQEYSLEDLKLFSKLLDLEGGNLKFGTHGEAKLKTMLPTQAWVFIGLALAWCAFWANVLGFAMPSIATNLSTIISGSLSGTTFAMLAFVLGIFSIIGLCIGKYKNLNQARKVALISRWLKLYIEVSENANNCLHKDA